MINWNSTIKLENANETRHCFLVTTTFHFLDYMENFLLLHVHFFLYQNVMQWVLALTSSNANLIISEKFLVLCQCPLLPMVTFQWIEIGTMGRKIRVYFVEILGVLVVFYNKFVSEAVECPAAHDNDHQWQRY